MKDKAPIPIPSLSASGEASKDVLRFARKTQTQRAIALPVDFFENQQTLFSFCQIEKSKDMDFSSIQHFKENPQTLKRAWGFRNQTQRPFF